jgi:membrane protease YdiL (CAAX protease family)
MNKNEESTNSTIYSLPLRENPKVSKKNSTVVTLFRKICAYFLLFRVVCELVPLWFVFGIICSSFILKSKVSIAKDWFKYVLEETSDSFKNKDPKKELVEIGDQIARSKPIVILYFPIIEEILFRNTCYSTSWQIINSILFGLLHISNISLVGPSKNICMR